MISLPLAEDSNKDIVVYINDFYPEFAIAFKKLSERLGRPLRGIMLIDAERKASGKYKADKEGLFEEIIVDFSDDAALRKATKPLENRLLHVACDSEGGQLYFKKVIPHVPYVYTPTESSLDYATDKGKMRELLLSFDSTISPKAISVHDATSGSIEKVINELSFPLIVKPANLAASILVNKVHDKEELGQVLERSFSSLNEIYSEHRGLGDIKMVVEEFVEGDLYSTDAYVDASGNVYVLPFIHFQNGTMVGMEGYQVYQTETHLTLSEEEITQGFATAKKAVHAIGLRSSVAHIELFHHKENGWKVVELGARPGGWRQEMYGVSYGINHAYNVLLIKVGLKPEMPERLLTHSATFRIHTPEAGILESITGLDEARKHPYMDVLRVEAKPGDKVLPSTHGGEVVVEGMMHHDNHEELNRIIKDVRSMISLNIKSNPETL